MALGFLLSISLSRNEHHCDGLSREMVANKSSHFFMSMLFFPSRGRFYLSSLWIWLVISLVLTNRMWYKQLPVLGLSLKSLGSFCGYHLGSKEVWLSCWRATWKGREASQLLKTSRNSSWALELWMKSSWTSQPQLNCQLNATTSDTMHSRKTVQLSAVGLDFGVVSHEQLIIETHIH